MVTTIESIQQAAATTLRAYHDKPDAPEHSRLLKQVAKHLVDLRERFLTEAGTPDWAGRTYAYRMAVGEIYSRSAVPKSDLAPITATIRYHVGNILRERLSEEELADAGLGAESPRERAQQHRREQSALVALFSRNESAGGESPIDTLRSIAAASALLARVTPTDVRKSSARDRRAAAVLLDEAAERAAELRKVAETA